MNVLSSRRRCLAVTAAATIFIGGSVIGLDPIVSHAAPSPDLLSPAAANSEAFGEKVLVLANGNYVVVDSKADTAGGPDVGAVYLYNGATDALISTLTGSHSGDQIGSEGLTEVGTSDFVVLSGSWHVGTAAVGAATWVDGTTGLNDVVSASNSIVGATNLDFAGAAVTALTNGNYVVSAPSWDGSAADVGAVTWAKGDGTTTGAMSTGNSLVGTTAADNVGSGKVTPLTNGNFVVSSPNWDDGVTSNVGAATWASGTAATSAAVSLANSIVGSAADDQVGFYGATALSNGNYVVDSPHWNNGVATDIGAVTWAGGTKVTADAVSTTNSLVGSTAGDLANNTVAALTNGNYVVSSPFWDSATAVDAGAATWADGSGPTIAAVTAANSLIGSTANDNVGYGGATALSNGNYVVVSPFFSTGAAEAGATTWAAGAVSTSDVVAATNSLTGASAFDHVGIGGVTALTNGNYVVSSPDWDKDATNADLGAVTWANGSTPTNTTVGVGNSIVGSTPDDGFLRKADQVGSGGITALTDGNYVVSSPFWNVGGGVAAGAATWGSGIASTSAAVSPINSLVGSVASGKNAADGASLDQVSSGGITALPDGNYVVSSPDWSNGSGLAAPGAATFGPAGGISGLVTAVNSAIGTPPVEVLSAAPRATASSKVLVATHQNRVLEFQIDLQPPALTVPDTIVVATDPGVNTRVVSFNVSATDNIGVQSVVCDRPSGSVFPLGDTTVQCTATDTSGLTNIKSFVVTVVDRERPVLVDMPNNLTVATDPGATSQAVTFTLPSATDNVGVQSVVCDHDSGSDFPIGPTTVTCTATDVTGLTTSASFTVTVTATPGVPAVGPDYQSLSGARLADTRQGATTTDDLFAGQGMRDAGSILELTVANRGGVPADAVAVALNVTAVGATASGFVTVFPCGSQRPTASNLNYTAGAIVPNAVIAEVGTNGKVCLFVSAPTHLVVDVNGSFPPSASYHPQNPARVLETRSGLPTVDGQQQGIGARAGGTVTPVQITGRASVPSDASAVALNVTVTEAQGPGFLTVFPCGSAIPTASNINFTSGSTLANLVVSKIGDGGAVCVFTNQATHVVVDVNGYFPAATSYHSLVPARLLDTRPTESTIDGLFLGGGRREAGEVTEVKVTERGGVPAVAGTVVLNVTVTGTAAAGFITVYPCGIATPLASNLNYGSGTTVANAVFAKVGTDGKVCLFNSAPTQVIVDVNGFFP